jgi:hypothetical protein
MGKKLYPTDTLKQARSILTAWKEIDPALAFGPLSAQDLSEEVADIRAMQEKIIQLKLELLSLRNERDAACINLWDKVKRARAGFKGYFGDDSSEYEMVGGTRSSHRKPYRRKNPVEVQEEASPQLDTAA